MQIKLCMSRKKYQKQDIYISLRVIFWLLSNLRRVEEI